MSLQRLLTPASVVLPMPSVASEFTFRSACPPHATFVYSLKQPSLADLTASLTQRKEAEGTAGRRHVQTDVLIK